MNKHGRKHTGNTQGMNKHRETAGNEHHVFYRIFSLKIMLWPEFRTIDLLQTTCFLIYWLRKGCSGLSSGRMRCFKIRIYCMLALKIVLWLEFWRIDPLQTKWSISLSETFVWRHFWARSLLGLILGSLGGSFEGCFGRGSGRLKLAKTPAAPKVVDFIVRNVRLERFLGSEALPPVLLLLAAPGVSWRVLLGCRPSSSSRHLKPICTLFAVCALGLACPGDHPQANLYAICCVCARSGMCS